MSADTTSIAPAAAPALRPRVTSEERDARAVSGWLALLGAVGCLLLAVALGIAGAAMVADSDAGTDGAVVLALAAIALVASTVLALGLVIVAPNTARVLTLFGRYVGTVRSSGLWFVNPLTAASRQSLSLRVRNFQTERLKVNDASGSPIEIAAVVVWRIDDTAKAVFDVDDVEEFVVVQSESAVRHLASQYPYDDTADELSAGAGPTLRGNAEQVADALAAELRDRLLGAGLEVMEARITHLAYAPEIAESMLRRQQAQAIVAARRTIVAGAVGLVDDALKGLDERGVVELDAERKAAMVSNLMVVLAGDRGASPVVNAGSLY